MRGSVEVLVPDHASSLTSKKTSSVGLPVRLYDDSFHQNLERNMPPVTKLGANRTFGEFSILEVCPWPYDVVVNSVMHE